LFAVGIGKPEPLKYRGSDVWLRRITQKHRCAYLIKGDRFKFLPEVPVEWNALDGIGQSLGPG